jgi:hypothetical protein
MRRLGILPSRSFSFIIPEIWQSAIRLMEDGMIKFTYEKSMANLAALDHLHSFYRSVDLDSAETGFPADLDCSRSSKIPLADSGCGGVLWSSLGEDMALVLPFTTSSENFFA